MINFYSRVAFNNLQHKKICKTLPLADIWTTALFPKDSSENTYAKRKELSRRKITPQRTTHRMIRVSGTWLSVFNPAATDSCTCRLSSPSFVRDGPGDSSEDGDLPPLVNWCSNALQPLRSLSCAAITGIYKLRFCARSPRQVETFSPFNFWNSPFGSRHLRYIIQLLSIPFR